MLAKTIALGDVIIKKAIEIANMLDNMNFKALNCWIENF